METPLTTDGRGIQHRLYAKSERAVKARNQGVRRIMKHMLTIAPWLSDTDRAALRAWCELEWLTRRVMLVLTQPDLEARGRVPRAGLEPACGCPRWILSPLRLPFRHLGNSTAGAPLAPIAVEIVPERWASRQAVSPASLPLPHPFGSPRAVPSCARPSLTALIMAAQARASETFTPESLIFDWRIDHLSLTVIH